MLEMNAYEKGKKRRDSNDIVILMPSKEIASGNTVVP